MTSGRCDLELQECGFCPKKPSRTLLSRGVRPRTRSNGGGSSQRGEGGGAPGVLWPRHTLPFLGGTAVARHSPGTRGQEDKTFLPGGRLCPGLKFPETEPCCLWHLMRLLHGAGHAHLSSPEPLAGVRPQRHELVPSQAGAGPAWGGELGPQPSGARPQWTVQVKAGLACLWGHRFGP